VGLQESSETLSRNVETGNMNDNVMQLNSKISRLEDELETLRNAQNVFKSKFMKIKQATNNLIYEGIQGLVNPKSTLFESYCLEALPNSHDRTSRKNVTVFSDIIVKDIVNALQTALPSWSVSACSSLGAPIEYTLQNYGNTLRNFSRNDFVVLMMGSYNFDSNSNEKSVHNFLERLIEFSKLCSEANLIITTIPYRYDLKEEHNENRIITIVNRAIRTYCSDFRSDACCVDLWTIHRDCHTRHGRNLNRRGKKWLSENLAMLIERIEKNSNESQDTDKERSLDFSLHDYTDEQELSCQYSQSNGFEEISVVSVDTGSIPSVSRVSGNFNTMTTTDPICPLN
jgi:hypothetical protein